TLTLSNEFNGNQSVYNITNGTLSVGNDFNGNQGVYNIYKGGVLDAGTNYSNINAGRYNIEGGTVIFSGIANIDGGNKIDFHNIPGGQLVIGSTSLSDLSGDSLNVENFVYGDQIKIASSTSYSDDTLSTAVSGDDLLIQSTVDGKTTTVVTIKGYATSSAANVEPAPTVTYSDGYILFGEQSDTGACFLAGSMVRTPQGSVAVENIQAGTDIFVYDWKSNTETTQQVTWAGQAFTVVNSSLPDDEAGYPVRILKDALADGTPYKDMLVTAEHCLFFNGRFVPARMLVNGASIFYDKSITSYPYYHVETAEHAVTSVDGVLTESYLDTGNRRSFRQNSKVVQLHSKTRTWEEDAAAPLGVDVDFVKPLFDNFKNRARHVAGSQTPAAPGTLTTDPNLHLVTQTGAVIRPVRCANQHYSFMLPPGTRSVQIVSRASRPANVIGPFVDDRRQLGVAVADIQLVTARQHATPITAHLQPNKPAGWHNTGWAECAWTNGNATLPLDAQTEHNDIAMLSITLQATGSYPLAAEVQENVQRHSA
ncbi:Hint domain-containing protein, partial [Acetobacter pasteurianus]